MNWYERPEYHAQLKEMRGWRLYYGDGSTFDSADGSWDEAPVGNVQVLMLYLEPPLYRNQVVAADEYYLPGGSSAKYGLAISDEGFYRIQDRAVHDYRWPGE